MNSRDAPGSTAKGRAAARPHQMPAQTRVAATASALAAFEALRAQLGEAETGPPSRGFGADALKVGGKIFAALSDGKLLLKLPAARVAALIAETGGEPFASGRRLMKEWVLASPKRIPDWPALAREARDFVARGGAAPPAAG